MPLDLTTYLARLESLVDSKSKTDAEALLAEIWGLKDPLSVAQAYYLQNFVIPSLYGEDCSKKKIPHQVHAELFTVPVEMPWEEWLSYFPNSVVEVREDKTGGATLSYELPESDVWQLEKRAGLFYSPNGFGLTPTDGHKTRRSVDNVVSLNAWFADFDCGEGKKDETLTKLKITNPRPSVIVETRNGFHAIWRIKGNIDLPHWKAVQNGLIDVCGSDKACKDPSRLLRMPYSWHCKSTWEGGEPYRTSIVSFDKEHFVSWDDMARYVQISDKPVIPRVYDRTKTQIYMPKPSVVMEGHRHGTLLEEAARLFSGLDESKAPDARDALKIWYSRVSHPLKKEWEKEVDDVVDWLCKASYGRII